MTPRQALTDILTTVTVCTIGAVVMTFAIVAFGG